MTMPIEQALEELKKRAQDFAAISDVNKTIKENKDEFIHKWKEVYQYYKYIVDNVEFSGEIWSKATKIITDISIDNPDLEEWIDLAVERAHSKPNPQATRSTDAFDPATISGPIESLITEVNSMQYFDPNNVGDIEWQLREYQQRLMANQNLFDPNVYQSLMDGINASLHKIAVFNDITTSKVEDSIRSM